MNLVVLGAPGAGKGTQAKRLAAYYKVPHISTGDILRDNVAKKTELGHLVADLIGGGRLIPDDLAIQVVQDRLLHDDCNNGYILDGFPRTLYQAETLADISKIDRAIYVNVSDDIIIERISGRLICPKCANMYRKDQTRCTDCGIDLIQREDDKQETVKLRLDVYHNLTEPIIDYYQNQGMILEIDGVGDVDDVTRSITDNLKAFTGRFINGNIH